MEKKVRFPENIPIDNLESFLIQIQEKKDFDPVVTLYFPSPADRDTHQQWHSLFSVEKADVNESELAEERKDNILALLNELDDYFKKIEEVDYSNTLVLFIGNDFFYSVKVPLILDLTLTIANYPFVLPLKDLNSKTNTVLVLSIDREEAVILTLEANRFKELLFYTRDQVPKKIRGGSESWKGLREKKILNHIEWHLNEHFKNVLNELLSILKKRKDIKAIYLGGHKEILPKFEKMIPIGIKSLIKERFVGEPEIFLKEVKAKGIKAVFDHKYKKGGG